MQLRNRWLGLGFALFAAPASAADRTVGLGSFDQVRVSGPFRVTVKTGSSPGAIISGDRRAIEAVDLQANDAILVIRPAANGSQNGESRPAPASIALSTPNLTSASVVGAGALTITGARGARLSIAVSGPGAITWAGAQADEAVVTVVGAGSITVGGRVGKARLTAGGAGSIDAAALDAGDLTVVLNGPGTIKAHARYTAQITNDGLGDVTITGPAKCTIRGASGGAVNCGKAAP